MRYSKSYKQFRRFCRIAVPVLVFVLGHTYVQAASDELAAGEIQGANAKESVEHKIASLQQELLSLSTDLLILEEELLYPASSRVAVYLSMDLGELFRLDAVSLKLNGKEVAHHLYTKRQVSALYRGGVQKLFVGNAKQGENVLTAVFTGQGPHARDYKRATTVEFEQSFEPVFVELGITDSTEIQQPEFSSRVY